MHTITLLLNLMVSHMHKMYCDLWGMCNNLRPWTEYYFITFENAVCAGICVLDI